MGVKLDVFLIVKALKTCNPGSSSGTIATIATQNGYLATIATQIGYAATIATQNGYVATLSVPKYLRDFARPKTNVLRLCATQKRYGATIATQNGYVLTFFSIVYVSFKSKIQYIFCSLKSKRKTYYSSRVFKAFVEVVHFKQKDS